MAYIVQFILRSLQDFVLWILKPMICLKVATLCIVSSCKPYIYRLNARSKLVNYYTDLASHYLFLRIYSKRHGR